LSYPLVCFDVSSFSGFLALKRRVICPVGVSHDEQKKMAVLQVQFIVSDMSSLQGWRWQCKQKVVIVCLV
jgi:hypothetical protein